MTARGGGRVEWTMDEGQSGEAKSDKVGAGTCIDCSDPGRSHSKRNQRVAAMKSWSYRRENPRECTEMKGSHCQGVDREGQPWSFGHKEGLR